MSSLTLRIQVKNIHSKKLLTKTQRNWALKMQIVFLRQAHRFIKKADKPLKEKIREEILKICENPQIGGHLIGKLKKLRSHHFSFIRTQYRIAYEIKTDLIIVAIGARENFYRDLIG